MIRRVDRRLVRDLGRCIDMAALLQLLEGRDLNRARPACLPRFGDLFLGRGDDGLGSKAEFPLQFLERRRGPERVHADAVAGGCRHIEPSRSVDACSTETRAVTAAGSTCSRYSGCWRQ